MENMNGPDAAASQVVAQVKVGGRSLTLNLSQALCKEINAKALEEGVSACDFGMMLIEEGLTRRAWELLESRGFTASGEINHREQQRLQHHQSQRQETVYRSGQRPVI